MGLAPAAFWSLTPREFWIKHRAFTRREDRNRSLILELAMLTAQISTKDKNTLERHSNLLRRYPIKKWLLKRED